VFRPTNWLTTLLKNVSNFGITPKERKLMNEKSAESLFRKERAQCKLDRKKDVRRIRNEGREAHKNGRPLDSCPYLQYSADALQWRRGFNNR